MRFKSTCKKPSFLQVFTVELSSEGHLLPLLLHPPKQEGGFQVCFVIASKATAK
jgi:hypothetical protein